MIKSVIGVPVTPSEDETSPIPRPCLRLPGPIDHHPKEPLTAKDVGKMHVFVRNYVGGLRKTNGDFAASRVWKKYVDECAPIMLSFLYEHKMSEKEAIADSYFCSLEDVLPSSLLGRRKRCPSCGCDEKDMKIFEEDGGLFCDCGIMYSVIQPVTKTPDHIKSKGGYCNYNNFINRLSIFQCEKNNEIPAQLYADLEKYYLSIGINCSEIRSQQPTPEGKKKGTSVESLCLALKTIKHTKYYWAIDGILVDLWGWRKHDISPYKQKMLDDYVETQKVYDEISTRSSSLNINLRLYWHLKIVGYPYCSIDMFRIPSTKDSLDYNCSMFRQMCQRSGLKYYKLE